MTEEEYKYLKYNIRLQNKLVSNSGLVSLDETLAFADKVPDAAAIIEVEIPQEILDKLADMTPVDTTIFKHGTVTINIDNLTEFNNAIKALRQVE